MGDHTPAHPASTDESWVGVDLGTHAVRVAIVTAAGSVLALSSVAFPAARHDADVHEQDADEWWRCTVRALASAVAEAGATRIRGIATSGTSGSVLLVENTPDDPARPLTPGVMYNDGRGRATAQRLVASTPAASWARTGFVPGPSSGLAKALWLFEEFDALGARRGGRDIRLAHQVDVITARLTGTVTAVDASHAMKSGVDLFTGDWPADDFDRLGIPTELFPAVVRPGAVLGAVSAAVAELTGVPAGTPVFAGMSDGCAGQISSGVLLPGAWCAVLGTTTVLKGVTTELLQDPLHSLYHHRSPGGEWWAGGASTVGAGVLPALFDKEELDRFNATADVSVPASIVSYPLGGTGERFPFVEPAATSFATGAAATRADLYASTVQGIALALRLCFERIGAVGGDMSGGVALVGGVAHNDNWMRLVASVLGTSIRIPGTPEGAVGMAVLAASTESSLAEAAGRMIRPGHTVDPVAELTARFEEPYAVMLDALRTRGWIDHVPATRAAVTT